MSLCCCSTCSSVLALLTYLVRLLFLFVRLFLNRFICHHTHTDENPQVEVALKHKVLQDVIVNSVYLGGSPSIVEEAGFGAGPVAYAKAQCAMSEHEGDPLIGQYASSAMIKIWEAAGLDISSIEPHGV